MIFFLHFPNWRILTKHVHQMIRAFVHTCVKKIISLHNILSSNAGKDDGQQSLLHLYSRCRQYFLTYFPLFHQCKYGSIQRFSLSFSQLLLPVTLLHPFLHSREIVYIYFSLKDHVLKNTSYSPIGWNEFLKAFSTTGAL